LGVTGVTARGGSKAAKLRVARLKASDSRAPATVGPLESKLSKDPGIEQGRCFRITYTSMQQTTHPQNMYIYVYIHINYV
jgi:hypothetical protein